MPARLSLADMPDYTFDPPVTVRCAACGVVVETGATDLSDAYGAAQNHEHAEQEFS